VYGLPELSRAGIASARLVANPGCYATTIQLALAPFKGMTTGRIVVDAMSGVTGAGRKATEEYSFTEISGDLRAYKALGHQHRPEIEQQLGVEVSFVPHLLPVPRGILATCHLQLAGAHDIGHALHSRYAQEPFVELADNAESVSLHHVVGTNKCRIGFRMSERGELVVTSAIDNLVKGAAGQAVQNMNLMLGLPEHTGLAGLRSFHP
jgi:N-acetyl-gamma-glutamyl-phosphate reductase